MQITKNLGLIQTKQTWVFLRGSTHNKSILMNVFPWLDLLVNADALRDLLLCKDILLVVINTKVGRVMCNKTFVSIDLLGGVRSESCFMNTGVYNFFTSFS